MQKSVSSLNMKPLVPFSSKKNQLSKGSALFYTANDTSQERRDYIEQNFIAF